MATLRERIRQSIGGSLGLRGFEQRGFEQERLGQEQFGQGRLEQEQFGQGRFEQLGQERFEQFGQERFGRVNVAVEVRQQHLVMAGLLSRIRDSDPAMRESLLQQLRPLCIRHIAAEEQVIYPALRNVVGIPEQGDQDEVEESVLEHMLMEQLLNRVLSLPANAPEWNQRFRHLDQLISLFMYHVREEEEVLLPLLLRNLPSNQVQLLGRRFMQVYNDTVTFPPQR